MAATSKNSFLDNLSPKGQLTAHQALKTAQATSFILPPAYLIYSIGKGQGLYVRKWMGFSIASVLAGAAIGVGIGYARTSQESDIEAAAQVTSLVRIDQLHSHSRADEQRHNKSEIEKDDWSIIGAFVGGVATPAIFLRRAPLPLLVLGGASIGLGVGAASHVIRDYSERNTKGKAQRLDSNLTVNSTNSRHSVPAGGEAPRINRITSLRRPPRRVAPTDITLASHQQLPPHLTSFSLLTSVVLIWPLPRLAPVSQPMPTALRRRSRTTSPRIPFSSADDARGLGTCRGAGQAKRGAAETDLHFSEIATNDADTEPDSTQLELIETWLADKDYEKEIIGVLKERLDSGWPFNYKALLVCKKLKDAQAIDLIDKVTPLTKMGNTTQGATHVRKEAKPLLDRATKAKNAKEAEEAKKRQDAIMTMWGGLWHDQPQQRPTTLTFPVNALPPGWTWPYSSNPPGYMPAPSPWVGKGPDGWTGAKVAANEQNIPFSRTLFTAMKPDKPPDNNDGVILKTDGKGR
ncbi:hypothetical protein A1Q2_00622 [Trichosporon asahii var. asahii CBS 8904]|uniref:Uncharacterized protein n=1 Tax=Trichosporon asahii var. asahii (strain CBS 8904) TaxID=1220162 RepID=K1W8C2_TRIAC|nr:hypothetical protein A1Q2_00622 [Trichosporon asahii var. asahii CBS 8904]